MDDSSIAVESGSTLSDGTPLDGLIDVDKREVSMRVLSDPEIYSLELDRLWSKSWLLVAHESEIPGPGDFVTRDMGADPVIITRDRNDDIHVLLNICRHRGLEVCRTELGNAKQFRCAYHGFVYGQDGRFLGSPIEREKMHGDVYSKSELGLRRARTEVFGGFVFATWDTAAPSLYDFLGDMRWYLELMWNRTDGGLQVLGPPQRYIINGNWKCAGEQFAGDGYHTLTLHRSLLELGSLGGGDGDVTEMAPGQYAVDVSTPQGHGMRCVPVETTFTMMIGKPVVGLSPMERLRMLAPAGLTPEMVEDLPSRFNAGQLKVLAESPPQAGGLFPNVGIAFFYQPITVDGAPKLAAVMAVHTFVPRGPEHFEFVNYLLAERDAPQQLKDDTLRANVFGLGSSGTVEQDDAEAWPSMTRASRGGQGRRQTMKYQALLGEHKPHDWPGGGLVYEGFSKDDNQWNWWLRYRDFLVGKAW